jgi:hypothetical protein
MVQTMKLSPRLFRPTLFNVAATLFCAAIVVTVVRGGDAQQSQQAGQLTREQRAAVEAQIARLPASVQPMARAEMERRLAEQAAEARRPAPEPVAERVATPADLAHNRAQWEPMIRRGFQAQKAFDQFVDATLAAKCPAPRSIARYGSAWRYELQDLQPNWVRGADSEQNTVDILGPTYSPKDGRYQFDFSQVRTTFDRAKVEQAITQACDELRAAGQAFYRGIDPLIAAQKWDEAYAYEQRAQGGAGAIARRLDAVIERENPAPMNAITLALMNGRRIG